jgi:hypothetical protein
MRATLKATLAAVAMGVTALAASSASALTLYEGYIGQGVFSFDPTNFAATEVIHSGSGGNVQLVGGQVYFEGGVTIYRANANLTGVTPIFTSVNAPNDFAFDPSTGYLYEAYLGGGLYAFDPTNFAATLVSHSGPVSNVYLAGGQVYFEEGTSIYRANADLTGVTPIWTGNANAPDDFAFDPSTGYLYEGYIGQGVFGFDPTNFAATLVSHTGSGGNVYLAGGQVYFEGGVTIYRANADLTGVTPIWTNIFAAPDDFAIALPPAGDGGGVPEPGAWALIILGIGLAGAELRRSGSRLLFLWGSCQPPGPAEGPARG